MVLNTELQRLLLKHVISKRRKIIFFIMYLVGITVKFDKQWVLQLNNDCKSNQQKKIFLTTTLK